MSHRAAKRIRQELFPAEQRRRIQDRRTSTGELLRGTTRYEVHPTAVRLVPWPLQELFGKIPVQMYQVSHAPATPRNVYRKVKRKMRRA